MAVTTFAAIDIGSYEVEMVIYEIGTKGIKQLDHVRHIIALGNQAAQSPQTPSPSRGRLAAPI